MIYSEETIIADPTTTVSLRESFPFLPWEADRTNAFMPVALVLESFKRRRACCCPCILGRAISTAPWTDRLTARVTDSSSKLTEGGWEHGKVDSTTRA